MDCKVCIVKALTYDATGEMYSSAAWEMSREKSLIWKWNIVFILSLTQPQVDFWYVCQQMLCIVGLIFFLLDMLHWNAIVCYMPCFLYEQLLKQHFVLAPSCSEEFTGKLVTAVIVFYSI